jgi:membrane protein YdbS with pleckstrin-like domain
MNKAFLIILIPAVVVSLAWLTAGWGLRVSVPVGVVVLLIAFVSTIVFLKRRKRNPEASR